MRKELLKISLMRYQQLFPDLISLSWIQRKVLLKSPG